MSDGLAVELVDVVYTMAFGAGVVGVSGLFIAIAWKFTTQPQAAAAAVGIPLVFYLVGRVTLLVLEGTGDE